ncbi:MAG: alanine racemase [Verrucomicrobiota bacterium]
MPSAQSHRAWVEVEKEALLHNINALREHLEDGVAIMAVVKANAYGHGTGTVVRSLTGSVEWFGVANVYEAKEVASIAPGSRILILGPALPEERPLIVSGGFTPIVSDLQEIQAYAALATKTPVELHLAIDTGMGRMGVWETEAVALVKACQSISGVRITGVGSHLPVSDEDDVFTLQQISRFRSLVQELKSMRLFDGVVHLENSAGAIGFPSDSMDIVRAGLLLYGCSPRPEFQSKLRSALQWKTRISLIRNVSPGRTISYGRTYTVHSPARIATLAVGYADGYQRHLSNRGAEVLVRGVRCPVVGRITMDQIMVDVTSVPEAQAGDPVVLIGRQENEEITVSELAKKAGTIPWEMFTGIGQRVHRCLAPLT